MSGDDAECSGVDGVGVFEDYDAMYVVSSLLRVVRLRCRLSLMFKHVLSVVLLVVRRRFLIRVGGVLRRVLLERIMCLLLVVGLSILRWWCRLAVG